MIELISSDDYSAWIVSIKSRVQASQIKAAIAVNRELLELYWFLGEQIVDRQEFASWGDGFLKQMSKDLLDEFPGIKGFSHRNLKYMRQWVRFWTGVHAIGQQVAAQLDESNVQQVAAHLTSRVPHLVTQIPWGHNLRILDKLDSPDNALFYVQKTIENNWSRAVLTHHIESFLSPLAPLRGEGLGGEG